jgi:hypothetical protein
MSNEYKDWYQEKVAEEKELVTKYPFLHIRDLDGCPDTEADFPMVVLEIPSGWHNLFYQLCDDIKDIAPENFYFLQVKEKYNLMRCYSVNSTPEIDSIIAKYEQIAPYICTICGKPAAFKTSGYIASFCTNCWKDHRRHLDGEFIKFQHYFTVNLVTEGTHFDEKKISFADEWNRYIKSN